MRATIMHAAGDVRIENVPDATILEPTDAVVRVTRACICGGYGGTDGAQAEAIRIPHADGTLFALPVEEDDALMPSLLTLSDVMGTGHHAAVVAQVGPGKNVAVVGDGAVGLCGGRPARLGDRRGLRRQRCERCQRPRAS